MKLSVIVPVICLFLLLDGRTPFNSLARATAAEKPGQEPGKRKAEKPAPGSEIFDRPTVLDFHVQLTEASFEELRVNPREYVRATVVVNGVEYPDVGVKLKGAAGSYRPVDDKPAMTLHFSKWADGRRVYGLRRLHLNNSVQDESLLCEYLGSHLFRSAGVPAARVAWATVRLNDRKLGLYVLKEAFENEFLRLSFGNDKGNLYEGGFVRDLERGLSKESGKGPDDQSDVRALWAPVEEKDTDKRWEMLQKVLDVDLFVTYAALSVMLVDWDGYPLNRNNYRIYFRPTDGKAVFMPHGMDQLFQRSYAEMDASWSGALAWAVFDTPQGFKLYEERCHQVLTNVFKLETMTNLIARATDELKKVEPRLALSANDLEYRVQRRHRYVTRDPFLNPPKATQPETAE